MHNGMHGDGAWKADGAYGAGGDSIAASKTYLGGEAEVAERLKRLGLDKEEPLQSSGATRATGPLPASLRRDTCAPFSQEAPKEFPK